MKLAKGNLKACINILWNVIKNWARELIPPCLPSWILLETWCRNYCYIMSKQERKKEKDWKSKGICCFSPLKQFSLLKPTFPSITKWIMQWGGKKKSPSRKPYGKPETILGLTFPAAESDEKQIKVKVNVTPHFPIRMGVRLYSNRNKNQNLPTSNRTERPSKTI